MPTGSTGQVRVLSNTNALTEFLPDTLSSFLATHRHVSIDLEERLSDEIVDLIADGVADIGIIAGTVDAGRLTTYPFRSDRFVLVVARDHPLAEQSKIGFADVLDYDFVGLDRASALQRFLAGKASRIGRPLRLRVQLRSFDAVCRLVEAQCRRRHRAGNHGAARGEIHRRSRWSNWPMPGRRAISPSACAISTRCRLTRSSSSLTCARRRRTTRRLS